MIPARNYRASIVITGSELLDGRVLDTNSNFLAKQCSQLGLTLRGIYTCDDGIDEIKRCLEFAAQGVELVIVSGGLGPTSDDLTRDALAALAGQPLYQDPQVLERLIERYRKRGRTFDPSNARQALFPQTAQILANSVGTAAGFALEFGAPIRTVFISLPGVPRELYAMWSEVVLPLLEQRFGKLTAIPTICFQTFGLPESNVGSRVEGCALPESVKVSYRAAFPEVHVSLSSTAITQTELAQHAQAAMEAVGSEFVFSRQAGQGLAQLLHALLVQRKQTLAVAESCSAGLLASSLAEIAGASEFLVGGTIAYANHVKTKALGVPVQLLEQYGAVSAEVASQMARAAREYHQADFGISITGVAGPGGGTSEKPVGLFYVGIADAAGGLRAVRYFFPNTRSYVRRYAVHCAMDVLRRHLLGLPAPKEAPLSVDTPVLSAARS
jgi:nicotinamide-nucleotide amidase